MISDKTWLKRGSSLPGGVGRVLHNLCYKVRHQVVQYSSKQGFCVLADCRMCDRTLRPPCSCNYFFFYRNTTCKNKFLYLGVLIGNLGWVVCYFYEGNIMVDYQKNKKIGFGRWICGIYSHRCCVLSIVISIWNLKVIPCMRTYLILLV